MRTIKDVSVLLDSTPSKIRQRLFSVYDKFASELFPDFTVEQRQKLVRSKKFEHFLLGQFEKLGRVKDVD